MSRFLEDWKIDNLQAAQKEAIDDNESQLDDVASSQSSMDIDMDPFRSDVTSILNSDSQPTPFSAQNLLPLELLEMIAIRVANDADLMNFILTCKDFAYATLLQKSTVWRTRFLARYDHPIIEGPYEFRIAYQLREMVLRKFPRFANKGGCRGTVALEVLRDIVLETYHGPENTKTTFSRNLDAISSPMSAPYMEEFLSSPFFAYGTSPYGKPNCLFDALQVVFSHLVLHPSSAFAATVRASRENYDLSVIYLYKVPLKLIYQVQPSRLETIEPQQKEMKLDLNALLHVRNFWHGHLAYEVTRMYSDAVPTYGDMARTLVEQNHAPGQWDEPIQYPSRIQSRWFGHYSCTHTSPRKMMDIEEHQTCAEDWINQYGPHGVHPLTLDIAITSFSGRKWWPPIFAMIPILASSTPQGTAGTDNVYIRGIAPFLSPIKHPNMYPAYTALRVRGVIHSLPDQQEIPGWKRIVMVMFSPTTRYLLAVLDKNLPEEDDPFDQIEPLPGLQASAMSADPNLEAGQAAPQSEMLPKHQGQAQNQEAAVAATPEAVEKAMKEELEGREELKGPLGPIHLTRDFIADMEDRLHEPEGLSWDDISYAWVYEGVIIPGGKIMMGRYWRCGFPTVVEGFEVGDGVDRGPWVFWC